MRPIWLVQAELVGVWHPVCRRSHRIAAAAAKLKRLPGHPCTVSSFEGPIGDARLCVCITMAIRAGAHATCFNTAAPVQRTPKMGASRPRNVMIGTGLPMFSCTQRGSSTAVNSSKYHGINDTPAGLIGGTPMVCRVNCACICLVAVRADRAGRQRRAWALHSVLHVGSITWPCSPYPRRQALPAPCDRFS